jgi:hypothetical protein
MIGRPRRDAHLHGKPAVARLSHGQAHGVRRRIVGFLNDRDRAARTRPDHLRGHEQVDQQRVVVVEIRVQRVVGEFLKVVIQLGANHCLLSRLPSRRQPFAFEINNQEENSFPCRAKERRKRLGAGGWTLGIDATATASNPHRSSSTSADVPP